MTQHIPTIIISHKYTKKITKCLQNNLKTVESFVY